MTDTETIADVIVAAVKAATAPLFERIAVLEARPLPVDGKDGQDGAPGAPGRDGTNGVDADPEHIRALVLDAVATLPKPTDGIDGRPGDPGRDGVDGKDADPEHVRAVVLDAVAALPVPKDGRDGTNGINGRDGVDGKDADPEHVRAVVLDAVAALPVPKDGQPGKDGLSVTVAQLAPVIEAEVAKAVALVPKAKDGVGILHATIDSEGRLVLMLSDGTTKDVGVVLGAAGKDGRDGQQGVPGRDGEKGLDGLDGKDGMGFDDIQVDHDGHGGFTLKFVRGDRQRAFGAFAVPRFEYHGVWTQRSFVKGDAVTWAGSLWLAKRETATKPGDGSPDWQLAVKRGSDGKTGPDGRPGPQGPRGDRA